MRLDHAEGDCLVNLLSSLQQDAIARTQLRTKVQICDVCGGWVQSEKEFLIERRTHRILHLGLALNAGQGVLAEDTIASALGVGRRDGATSNG